MRIVVAISAPPASARTALAAPRRPLRCGRSPRARAPARCDGDDSPPVTRCTGWSSQSKRRRWISSASQPPYDVPRAPCSTISTALVFLTDASIVSQSSEARSSQRRSMTSASMPVCSTASRLCCDHREVADDRHVGALAADRRRCRTGSGSRGRPSVTVVRLAVQVDVLDDEHRVVERERRVHEADVVGGGRRRDDAPARARSRRCRPGP